MRPFMKPVWGLAIGAMLLSGCASGGMMPSMPGFGGRGTAQWTPTIDTRGVDQQRYEQDFVECRAFAEANPDADAETAARDGAVRSGLGMAALTTGAAVLTGGLSMVPLVAGAIVFGGGAGAAVGAESGRTQAELQHRQIITGCLTGRGYSVIG